MTSPTGKRKNLDLKGFQYIHTTINEGVIVIAGPLGHGNPNCFAKALNDT
jgi:hypothetical protein